MIHTIINSVGLLLGIAGTVLIWKYGLPANVDRQGFVARVTDNVDPEQIALGKKFDFWSNFGLGLLVGSFILQIISNFIPF